MLFFYQKRVKVDWNGRYDPVFKEDVIGNSVIIKVTRHRCYAPYCEREIITGDKPLWNPHDRCDTYIRNNRTKPTIFIPGIHPVPPYPRLSTLSKSQQQQALRVVSAKYHTVQPRDFKLPSHQNYEVFEEIRELYEIEQKEYQKWAKQLWINGHCIRALRPKPLLEAVYDAEFKMRAAQIQCLPKNYTLAAQIPLETKNQTFEFEHKKDLLNVDIKDLPLVDYPDVMESHFSVLNPYPLPEPCTEHPCKFILPGEESVSGLPLTEIHHEIAQYAIENGVTFAASENALRCLLETERNWKIPITVVEAIGPDGDLRNVVVLGSEFSVQKELVTQRTYKAYKHLLRQTFAPSTGHYRPTTTKETSKPKATFIPKPVTPNDISFEPLESDLTVSSDKPEDKLQIIDNEPKWPNLPGLDTKLTKESYITSIHESPESLIEQGKNDGKEYSESDSSSHSDRLMIDDNDTNPELPSTNKSSYYQGSYEPDLSSDDDKPDYSLNDPGSESDTLMIDDGSDLEPRHCVNPRDTSFNVDKTNYGNESNQTTNKEFSQTGFNINDDFIFTFEGKRRHSVDKESNYCLDTPSCSKTFLNKPNYSNDTSDSDNSESGTVATGIRYDTNKEDDLLETNEDASINLLETNEDVILSVSPSIDNDTNENASLESVEENRATIRSLTESDKDNAPRLFKADEIAKPILFETGEAGISNLSKINKDNTLMLPEPIKKNTPTLLDTGKIVSSLSKTTEDNSLIETTATDNIAISNLSEKDKDATLDIFRAKEDTETNKDNTPRLSEKEVIAILSLSEMSTDVTQSVFETNKDGRALITNKNVEPSPISSHELQSTEIDIGAVSSRDISEVPLTSVVKSDVSVGYINVNSYLNKRNVRQATSIRPCIKKSSPCPTPTKDAKKISFSESVLSKLSITETDFRQSEDSNKKLSRNQLSTSDDSNKKRSTNQLSTSEISKERAKTFSEEIYRENDYCQLEPNDTASDINVTASDINEIYETSGKHSDINESANSCPDNQGTNNPKAGNVRIRELFGDESDSDESICNNSNRNIDVTANESNIRALIEIQNSSDIEYICNDSIRNTDVTANESNIRASNEIQNSSGMEYICNASVRNIDVTANESSIRASSEIQNSSGIEKSPLRPCLRKSSFSETNHEKRKRKLSFSDPLTSGPEFRVSVSESESEESLVGFNQDGLPISKEIQKKQNKPLTSTYTLRTRIKPIAKPSATKISKTKQTKDKSGFIKTPPKTNKRTKNTNVALRSRSVSAHSDSSDDSNYSESSRPASNRINNKKQKEIQRHGLRRSRRLSSRTDVCDKTTTKKAKSTNNLTETTKNLRRSQRLSFLVTKENLKPKSNTNEPRHNESYAKTKKNTACTKLSKATKKYRRKSLPSNIISKKETIKQVLTRSNSLMNLDNIAKTNRVFNSRSSSSTSLHSINKNKTLELSERTKRHFHRSISSPYSETDISEGEMSERTKRYIRRSMSSAGSETEQASSELRERTKRYTRRTNTTSPEINTRKTNNSKPTSDKNGMSDRDRHRSANLTYSSCDESEQPKIIRRKKTKSQPELNRTATNAMHSTQAMETNNIELANDRMKTELMDTTEYQTSAIEEANDSVEETCEIKIYLAEEITDDIEMSDIDRTHTAEPNQMDTIENHSNTEGQLDLPENKHDEHHVFHFKATNDKTDTYTNQEPIEIETEVTNLTVNNETIPTRKTSVSEDSVNSDYYFEDDENADVNVFYFTARNSDSEDESEKATSTVQNQDENPSSSNAVAGFLRNQPGTSRTQNFYQSHTTETNIATRNTTENETTKYFDRERKNSLFSLGSSEDLEHEPFDVNELSREAINDIIGVNNCICKGTLYEIPPPRSFKKWQVRNTTSNVSFSLMVHSSHKTRKGSNEVLLEPIVEYQPELGGAKQSEGRMKAIALSLMLREKAKLINVRIDHENGNVIVVENLSEEEFTTRHGAQRARLADTLHTAIDQLRYLMPGQYVLAHDSCHGANAMLYTCAGWGGEAAAQLSLHRQDVRVPDAEDALNVKTPPELDSVLLPYHKLRSILPLSFTPYPNQVREDKRAALARAKLPPTAIQWPKKKKKSKRNRQQRQAVAEEKEEE